MGLLAPARLLARSRLEDRFALAKSMSLRLTATVPWPAALSERSIVSTALSSAYGRGSGAGIWGAGVLGAGVCGVGVLGAGVWGASTTGGSSRLMATGASEAAIFGFGFLPFRCSLRDLARL